ncbi:hypothetical protein BV25DRAFT_1831043 [Artomyces pyxidatus]|uniref:Uncharacterized protein n=1 Tax=Artomyces pyxidatus TaxID=48021 RepID=A0ACB8SLY4_9AGAM|nr:hypothetical protein BV25DRAFT_1831043 [Artomyces pyxidatus]
MPPRYDYSFLRSVIGNGMITQEGHTVEHCVKYLKHAVQFHRQTNTTRALCLPAETRALLRVRHLHRRQLRGARPERAPPRQRPQVLPVDPRGALHARRRYMRTARPLRRHGVHGDLARRRPREDAPRACALQACRAGGRGRPGDHEPQTLRTRCALLPLLDGITAATYDRCACGITGT